MCRPIKAFKSSSVILENLAGVYVNLSPDDIHTFLHIRIKRFMFMPKGGDGPWQIYFLPPAYFSLFLCRTVRTNHSIFLFSAGQLVRKSFSLVVCFLPFLSSIVSDETAGQELFKKFGILEQVSGWSESKGILSDLYFLIWGSPESNNVLFANGSK